MLAPFLPHNLKPFHSGGLCDAVIITPPSLLKYSMEKYTTGVVTTPTSMTLHPTETSPLTNASLRALPLNLASIPTIISLPLPMKEPKALPSLSANSVVKSLPKIPLMSYALNMCSSTIIFIYKLSGKLYFSCIPRICPEPFYLDITDIVIIFYK